MVALIRSDLEFILQQIRIAEAHTAGASLNSLIPNVFLPWGLRTVDGTFNNLVPGQQNYGAADQNFPLLLDQVFRTDYASIFTVVDPEPRIISNLIVDQTISNPVAVQAFVDAGLGTLDVNGVLLDLDGVPIPAGVPLFIGNTAPDEGLSAGFNTWFVFFGQFFDHGLDLVNKQADTFVFVPLQPDDPLFVDAPGAPNFMVISRATNTAVLAGSDGIFNTSDDVHLHNNQTTPFVDQNQTYTSHPSHQVFLREYVLVGGVPVDTGRLLEGANGGLATWADVKAQAQTILGINLTDADVKNLPGLLTDLYGNFIPGDNGFPQLVTDTGLVEGDPSANGGAGVDIPANVGRTNHAFLDDIAHAAAPVFVGGELAPDSDNVVGLSEPGTYDDELLDAHFITGDGRGNENIGLTTVHHVFHSEHNRLVDHLKDVALASNDVAFLNEWLRVDVTEMPSTPEETAALEWDGVRLFQAARFATEMQYQHLVFEEFARKVQPQVDAFLMYDATINPAILAEFAHVVYRFGHSMLTETVDRFDADFSLVGDDTAQIGLIEAFLNPLEFAASGLTADQAAGAIVRGTTRTLGNEIDEFITEALRNNLVGLPLDLAAINLARGRDTGVPTLNAARAEFYRGTGDSQLKPYTSWADFAAHMKHPESLVNFIAAYGTHAELKAADVDTLEERRAVALALVLGGTATINAGTLEERVFTANEQDRLDFLNSTGAYANDAGLPKDLDGVTTTGLGNVDLWIGGLAEQQMPFGGLLGSTFNFVFETQLEALQNGDRFYYLGRLAGTNFLTELENASFAKLIMRNTDATHLPADVFSTPAWILEVNDAIQFTGLGADGRDDPTEGGTELRPLVIRDNPATDGPDSNYLEYTGVDHVVLGGTSGDDILIGSIGDDTLWGDAGNDRLEGGDGVDNVEGGDGDDIITDKGGDDVLKGGAGNDVIHGGNGFNLLLGGTGNDFIITGEDVSETFAGPGNDFILGAKTNLPTLGNEGDDWIEIGTQDGAPGDNFDLLSTDIVPGHDVFVGGGGFDEMLGEGGDDMFVGSEGEDHFDGDSGFDWVTFKNDTRGVVADMVVSDIIEAPVAPSNAGILDRYAFVEGLSGSAHADILRGDDADAAAILAGGAQGSVLNQAGIERIAGLQALLGAGVSSFGAGNIILGGDGSDIIEGRGGDDLIDGDAWLNVRVSVRDPNDHSVEIRSVDSIADLVQDMLSGAINPGQLEIVREILPGTGGFDTAVYSGPRANYLVTTAADGTTIVTDTVGTDGTDTLKNVERLLFADQTLVLVPDLNGEPLGVATIVDAVSGLPDDTPIEGQVLRASIAGVTDTDNVTPENPTGAITGPVYFVWQVETVPGSGVFDDIIEEGGDKPATASGDRFQIPDGLGGLAIRVKAIYQDANGVLETVFSAATQPVVDVVVAPPAPLPLESPTTSAGVHFIRSDLQFILDQIKIAERHAAGEELTDILPNTRVAFGLRTVDGSFNNLVLGQNFFGAADQNFPLLLDQIFRNEADGETFDANGPAPGGVVSNTNYATTTSVVDSDPRMISNLIVDQTANNFAAVAANAGADPIVSPGLDGVFGTDDDVVDLFFIGNTTPDEGLSAGFNAWFVFFGQFFDHGLDLVNKGGNGVVYIPLQPDDPLYVEGGHTNFMVLTRATNTFVGAGADGVFNTADDVHFHNNQTTPFVDQNQTYTSHPSHQVFLREYVLVDLPDDGIDGVVPVDTGRLLEGANGGLATWADVKAQAENVLGIVLDDADVVNLPLLATDLYGNFIRGANGMPILITLGGEVEASLGAPVDASLAMRTNHAFMDDIAHSAAPLLVGGVLTPDGDEIAGNAVATDPLTGARLEYDDELLDAHYITGDGRGNENIGLTTVHHVFHSEHNRLVDHIKDVAIASNDVTFLNEWLLVDVTELPATPEDIAALQWDGARLFQAARFGTEMQYQHLVFEEFARKVQPQVDLFFAATQVYDTAINPAIFAEFAHVVYRFGHSMLTESIDRFDPAFNIIDADPLHPLQDGSGNQIGLIAAFLNPLAFAASGVTSDEAAGAIVRGTTRQLGNEIDEFITEALRNNLVGLPLDLATINLARGRDAGVPTLNAARAEFYAMTGDSQLKPYTSWVDFAANIKHVESLVNFIAAYGTHSSITSATDLAGRREAAFAIVYGAGGFDGDPLTTADNPTVPVPADRMEFLTSTGAWANGAGLPKDLDGATTTGLGNIDLWIGGLAEKQMPFGGLLGSTFNFVFETQMEMLQDGDRFYYLERTAGLNFLSELENNSFARMIMINTDATHLPADVFSTPAWILEVDQSQQFTGLGADGRADPADVVIRDNPATAGADANYLEYTGEDHVVLGGTNPGNAANPSGNDILIASIGDDTIYGDAGNDRIEGGDGVDQLRGGAGDDIITDKGGDDNIQGGDGNDVIHGGNGINLILGGFGKDFIITGEDASEAFGGTGDDFILGVSANEFVFGNEGDDWLQLGMADGAAGDNFDPFASDPVLGNDVFFGEGITDRMDGEGGDDIMMGNGGQGDRYEGMSGFDWASFAHHTAGISVDMRIRAFDETPLPLGSPGILTRFEAVEGLSGSQHSDVLQGTDDTAATLAPSGVIGHGGTAGSVLNQAGIDRIAGMQAFLNDLIGNGGVVTSFGAGNIILGGDGSDIIIGGGGDDLVDGDMRLSVYISVRAFADGTGPEITRATDLTQLAQFMVDGTYNPGQLVIVRELVNDNNGSDFDTARFSGALLDLGADGLLGGGDDTLNYSIAVNGVVVANPLAGIAINPGDIVTVTDLVGLDGVDTIRNVERLQFTDQSIILVDGVNSEPEGLVTISDATPAEDQLLTASIAGVTDADNVSAANPAGAITGPVTYFWQMEVAPGVWEDILFEDTVNGGGEAIRATGQSFTPGDAQVGFALRVRVLYQDANGVLEEAYSAPTAPVANVNDAPVGTVVINDPTPTETQELVASIAFTDVDGLTLATFTFQWQQSALGGGGPFTNIDGATAAFFIPGPDQVNRQLQVVVSYTDDGGTLQTVTSAATAVVGDFFTGTAAADVFVGTEGADIATGAAAGDTLLGNGGDDILDGGAAGDIINGGDGNDTIIGGAAGDTLLGGAGNDTFNYAMGDGVDTMDGGADADTLNITGGAGNDVLDVTVVGSTITVMEGGTVLGIENVNANLNGGTDTLNYSATLAATAIAVNLAAGTATGFASIAGIDNVTGGAGNDSLTGNDVANVLTGGAGNDLLNGGLGNDALNGGGGTDTASFAGSTDAFVIDLAAGTARRGTAASPVEDTMTSIENVTGGSGGDTISGTGAANTIVGGGGDDIINGLGGADIISGGLGDDTITGGTGNDSIDAGGGDDIIIYNFGDGADTVDGGPGSDTLVINGTAAANVLDVNFNGVALTTFEGGSIVNVEAVVADLLGGTDTLNYTGTTAAVTVDLGAGTASGFISIAGIENVTGGAGADTLSGSAGVTNVLTGGGGNDIFFVHDTADTVSEAGGLTGGVDEVRSFANVFAITDADVENLTFVGTGDFVGTGNGAANVLVAGAGNDVLNGGGGADRLTGGGGDDIMDGGAGNDTFVFAAGFGNDIINGFDPNPGGGGQDLLDISATGITVADFDARVLIEIVGTSTLVTIDGVDTILLNNVSGVNGNSIQQTDFILGGP